MEVKRKQKFAFEDKRPAWFMIGAGTIVVLLVLYAGVYQTPPAALSEIQSEPLTAPSSFFSSYMEDIGNEFGDWTDKPYGAGLAYEEPVVTEEIFPEGH